MTYLCKKIREGLWKGIMHKSTYEFSNFKFTVYKSGSLKCLVLNSMG